MTTIPPLSSGSGGFAFLSPMKTAAVSIDLDEVHHYRAIHGLPARGAGGRGARAVFEVAVPRALALASKRGLRITFFVVAEDLEIDANADLMREALALGHEVESHSASHPYDLVRLPRGEVRREIEGSFEAIDRTLGVRPHGFRAPGYTLSDDVLDTLEQVGATFDASLLPSPPYYVAKLAALGAIFATGRMSTSIVGPPRSTMGPTEPYRPGRPPWARGARRLIEIPMRVTPGARLPVIGTSVCAMGPRIARALVRACATCDVFSFELHGMDFLDRTDGLSDLVGHVTELRRPLEARMQSLEAALDELDELAFRRTTLREIAKQLDGGHASGSLGVGRP